MHVKTNCKNFKWKKSFLVDGIKMDKNILMKPHCYFNKFDKFLNCPNDCEFLEEEDM
jgi:hypothetical protein